MPKLSQEGPLANRLTITEALAEIKTIGKRVEKKREFIGAYAMRQEMVRDPLESDGGSRSAIDSAIQSIQDLYERIVKIRSAIAKANASTPVTLASQTRSIAEWLTWRREVAPLEKTFLQNIRGGLANARKDAQSKQIAVRGVGERATEPHDVIVNVNEKQLADRAEEMELILGTLDGQLSLLNATTFVTIK